MDFEAMVSCVCERMKKKLGKHYWTDYLQFVQEEQLRCGGVEGVKKSPKKKKAKKSSKVKKGAEEPKEEAVKGKARRPDLKAISKKYLFSPGGSDLSNLKTCGHTTAFYPKEEARKKINLVDSKGLIVKSRVESLQHFKKPWAHEHEPIKHLVDAVKVIKPTVLIGTSGVGKTFTKEVVEAMAALNEKPIIFSLSNPTSQSECTAEEAYTWSKENSQGNNELGDDHDAGRNVVLEDSDVGLAETEQRRVITDCTFVDNSITVEHARDYGHVHLSEIISHADKFKNKAILLIHFSARYSLEEISKAVSAIPASLAPRVETLTEGR